MANITNMATAQNNFDSMTVIKEISVNLQMTEGYVK
jgi:hypothetical protein